MQSSQQQQDMNQYQLGYIDANELKPSTANPNPSFRPISKSSSIDICFEAAKNNKGNCGDSPCRFMAFDTTTQQPSDWNCYVGNINNISKAINQKTGIATYIIPQPSEDITLTKYQLINDSLKNELKNKQSELDENEALLYCAKNGLTVNDTTSKNKCMALYKTYKQTEETKQKQAAENEQKQKLEEQQQFVQQQSDLQTQLLDEKNKVNSLKESYIDKNNKHLNYLEKKLLLTTQLIKNTQDKYQLNDNMVYLLTTLIIVFFILVLVVCGYYGYKYIKYT